jgi:hypothetical protein
MLKFLKNLAICDASARVTAGEVALLVIVLAGLFGLRVYKAATQEVISRDGVLYVQMAQQWSADPMGVISRYDYHVGYPVAIAGVHEVMRWAGFAGRLDAWDISGQAISVIASTIGLLGVWVWSRRLLGPAVAIMTMPLASTGTLRGTPMMAPNVRSSIRPVASKGPRFALRESPIARATAAFVFWTWMTASPGYTPRSRAISNSRSTARRKAIGPGSPEMLSNNSVNIRNLQQHVPVARFRCAMTGQIPSPQLVLGVDY